MLNRLYINSAIRRNEKYITDNMLRITCLCDCQVIRVKKLRLISQLHIVAQSWFNTAVHCRLYISSKVTMQFIAGNSFGVAQGQNTKRPRILCGNIPGGSSTLLIWKWPSYFRTRRIWLPSWILLTNGRSSWLLLWPISRRLSVLSVNRSVRSSKASPSGSPCAAHRTSKDKPRYQGDYVWVHY